MQAVLLFRLETWVVTHRMVNSLAGFQDQVARRLTGRLARRKPDGKWTYTLVTTARVESGLLTMEDNTRRLQNTVTQYIATRSLLDLCEGSERAPGARVGMWWLEDVVINLARAREAAAAMAEGDGG